VLELAELVRKAGVRAGFEVDIRSLDNPRVEAETHYYNPAHTKLLDLGLRPHLLSAELVGSMLSVIDRFRDRVIEEHIEPQDRWRPTT
jgi:UDP-sulfoquinovose synthase